MPRGFRALFMVPIACVALVGCGGPPRRASCTARAPSAAPVTVTVEQASAATTIAAVGRRLRVPDHGVTVALATAEQESGLVNVKSGDRDSLGLF